MKKFFCKTCHHSNYQVSLSCGRIYYQWDEMCSEITSSLLLSRRFYITKLWNALSPFTKSLWIIPNNLSDNEKAPSSKQKVGIAIFSLFVFNKFLLYLLLWIISIVTLYNLSFLITEFRSSKNLMMVRVRWTLWFLTKNTLIIFCVNMLRVTKKFCRILSNLNFLNCFL